MFLRRIIVQDFKNISSADISFSPKINCICGNNGEGKTNLLDAVHYLSMTKSFLSVNDRYTYTYGKDEAVLHGTFQDTGQEEDIAVSVRSDGAKTVRRNGKAYKRLSEHVGRIPVVMTAPPDISLIHDSGEERRRFLNMMISQIDPEYLRSVSAYNSLLKQRNASLRQEGTPDLLLETISGRMCAPAAYIHARRREAAEQLAAKAAGYYGFISGGRESIGIRYRSDLEKAGLEELLAASLQKDRALGYTTAAVHPAEGANYNRVGALPWLGFDTCVFREDLTLAPEDTTRGFMRDSALFRQVTGMLEETDDPMFLFCITMQNHGGYTNADYESPVQLLWPEGCDEAEQYLGLVHESDAALAELIGALEELDEPTLVIFFGDHQPELGSDFSQAVLDESDPFAQYTTPYLIWANYPLEEDQLPENGSRIGIAALNPLVARAAGFPLTGWQKFLLEFYTQTPVMAQMGGTNAAGEYLTMEQLKQQPLADEYQILQYAMLFAEEQKTGLWRLAEG